MRSLFIETHMHISLNGDNAKKYRRMLSEDEKFAEDSLRRIFASYKARGILALRDGGDSTELYQMARKVAGEEGIIYKTPIYGLYKKGHYGGLIGKPVDGIKDIDEHFKDLMRKKADFVKIVLSGIVSFKEHEKVGDIGFKKEEFEYIVKKAKDSSLSVMVHVNSSEGVKMAIDAGVNSIEHGYYLTYENLYAMKEKDIIWVPTLAPLGNIIYSNDKKYKSVKSNVKSIFEGQCEKVKQAWDIGVKIAVGSDAGAYRVYHGSGFFDELIYLNKSGIRKRDLLSMACNNGAEVLGITKNEMKDVEDRIANEG